jgi:hypothetical protein
MTYVDRMQAAIVAAGPKGIDRHELAELLGTSRSGAQKAHARMCAMNLDVWSLARHKQATIYFAKPEWLAAAEMVRRAQAAERSAAARARRDAAQRDAYDRRRAAHRAKEKARQKAMREARYRWPRETQSSPQLEWHVGAELQRAWTAQP